MLPRFVRIQLIAFGLITVLALGYASFAYVGLPRLLGFGRYSASVQLAAAGGIYSGAQVTLRGNDIGQVTGVRLTPDGVAADVSLNDQVRVPADSTAEVRSTSAIGEQYIELVPPTPASSGPVLAEGGVLSRSTLPTPINNVLEGTNRLVASIPQDKLRTALDESSAAFSGTGNDLQLLLDSSDSLVREAQTNLQPTVSLINNLQPVLATQLRGAPDIRSYWSDLAGVTDQIRADDPALRGVLAKTPPFAKALGSLEDDIRPTLPVLLANLTSVGQVLEVYAPNAEHALVVLPSVVNNFQSALNNNRGVPSADALDFKLTVNDPPPCTTGFDTPRRTPAETDPIAAPTNSYCKEPADSPILPRGARMAPCPNDPAARAADAQGCGLVFPGPREVAERQRNGSPPAGPGPPPDGDAASVPASAPYDPKSGMFFAPDGQAFVLGESTRSGSVPAGWKSLFLDPLGIPTS